MERLDDYKSFHEREASSSPAMRDDNQDTLTVPPSSCHAKTRPLTIQDEPRC